MMKHPDHPADAAPGGLDSIDIEGLSMRTVIGIFPEERDRKQEVVVSLRLTTDTRPAAASDRIEDAVDYKALTKQVITLVENASDQLIERLAERIAQELLTHPAVSRVRVRVEKPGALRYARTVAVTITRDRAR